MSNKQKARLTSADISALVNQLQFCVGSRVANVYDVNTRTYIFKLASKSDSKDFLFIENGIRFYLSNENATKNKIPSGFTMKMRKYLRGKRIDSIQQIGVERVVQIKFGADDLTYYLILEFYSQGNLIVTDKDFKILQLMRTHEYPDGVSTALNQPYPFDHAANLFVEKFDLSEERMKTLLAGGDDAKPAGQHDEGEPEKKEDKKGQKKIREILFKLLPCLHHGLVDDILESQGIQPNLKAAPGLLDGLKKAVAHALDVVASIKNHPSKGYVVTKPGKENDVIFFDFMPYEPRKKEGFNVMEFPDFNSAVEHFFSKIQPIKIEKEDKETLAWKKFENIKEDQAKRLKKLQNEQSESMQKAALIELNLQDVDAIINIIQTMIKTGLGWDKITKMINEGKKKGDPLGMQISRIIGDDNIVVLLLGDPLELEAPLQEVEIDVTISAHLNARRYYEEKKKMAVKEKKTAEATNQALEQAKKSAQVEMKKEKNKTEILKARKTFWFEKFYWFITSENYLVISGKDAQQNEMLVKRYMKQGDVYMHADIMGASSTIIKNPSRKALPQATLEEAAVATICRSKAWDSKMLTSAWWVYHTQVSKTAPSGEFLRVGSFMIRGKKNFIYPTRVEMGLALLFKVDEKNISAHLEDRKPRTLIEDLPTEPVDLQGGELVDDASAPLYHRPPPQLPPSKAKEPPQKGGKGPQPQAQKGGKKGKEEDSEGSDEEDQDDGEEEKKKGPGPLPRGKKNKLKKIKEKYGDQDEDERAVRMQLMGAKDVQINSKKKKNAPPPETKGGKPPQEKGKKGDDSKQHKEKDAKVLKKDEEQKKPAEKAPVSQAEAPKPLAVAEPVTIEIAPKEPLPAEPAPAIETPILPIAPSQDAEKSIPAEEDDEDDDDDEEEKVAGDADQVASQKDDQISQSVPEEISENEVAEINQLVNAPLKDDTIQFLVPVCAPYISLHSYKYKVKLVPGTLKKGKAAKLGLDLMIAQPDTSALEKQFIKHITDQEVVAVMVGNCKVAAAGLLKFKEKERQRKREAQKDEGDDDK